MNGITMQMTKTARTGSPAQIVNASQKPWSACSRSPVERDADQHDDGDQQQERPHDGEAVPEAGVLVRAWPERHREAVDDGEQPHDARPGAQVHRIPLDLGLSETRGRITPIAPDRCHEVR